MTNDNPSATDSSWPTIVSKGNKVKVPYPLRRVDIKGLSEAYTVDILFEEKDIAEYYRHQRALSIVQTAIQPGAVIFSVPSKLFGHQSDAYKLVLDQLGPVVGNYFNPLSLRGSRSRGDLVFFTKFREETATQKALQNGLLIDGTQYKAIPYKDKTAINNYLRVNLTLNVCEEDEDLADKLKSSMSNYGKVMQIKRLLNRGFFEGEISVLLDRENEETHLDGNYQELQRMLYLDAWDVFAPASFKGAKPICYYCREAGHVKRECPSLLKIVCYECGDKGHTRHRCPTNRFDKARPVATGDDSFTADLEAYEAASQSARARDTANKRVNATSDFTSKVLEEDMDDFLEFSDSQKTDILKSTDITTDEVTEEDVEMENSEGTAEKPVVPSGAYHSKFAPIEDRLSMDTDPKDFSLPKTTATGSDSLKLPRRVSSRHNASVTALARKGHE